jgi:hypothetical protein
MQTPDVTAGVVARAIVACPRSSPFTPSTVKVGFQSPLAQGDPTLFTTAMKNPLEPIAREITLPFGAVKRIVRPFASSVRPAMRYVCWFPPGELDAPTRPAISGAAAWAGAMQVPPSGSLPGRFQGALATRQ